MFGDRLFTSPWDHALLNANARNVAEEVHDAINARTAFVTWIPLSAAAIIYRLPTICPQGAVSAGRSFVGLVTAVILVLGAIKLPFRLFQGRAASLLVLLFTVLLDVGIAVVPDSTFGAVLCSDKQQADVTSALHSQQQPSPPPKAGAPSSR